MSSASQKTFRVLYTNQIRKKVPSYSDGFLRYYPDTKSIVLLDEKNNRLEQSFLNQCGSDEGFGNMANIVIQNGEEFRTKGYKIQVEDEIVDPSNPESSSGVVQINSKPNVQPPKPTSTPKTIGRKGFKPPLKENYDTWRKNLESGSFSQSTQQMATKSQKQNERVLNEASSNNFEFGDFEETSAPNRHATTTSKFFRQPTTQPISSFRTAKSAVNDSTTKSNMSKPIAKPYEDLSDEEIDFEISELQTSHTSIEESSPPSTANFLLKQQQKRTDNNRTRYIPPIDDEEKEIPYIETFDEEENFQDPKVVAKPFKPSLDLIIDDDFQEQLVSSEIVPSTKTNKQTCNKKKLEISNLDLSLDNLDVDSDEDLETYRSPKKSIPKEQQKSVFKPPTVNSTNPPPKPIQAPKRVNINFDDDDQEESFKSTPQKFVPPKQFTPPEEASLPSKKFVAPKISPNKKFKQTQLSIGQQKTNESPNTNYVPTNSTSDIPVLSLVHKLKRIKHDIVFPDEGMNDLFEQNNTHPKRFVEVPDKFSSIEHYKAVFLDALYEEMNLQIFNLGMNFYKTYRKITQTGSSNLPKNDNAPTCKCGQKAKLAVVKKEGANKGKTFYACPKQNRAEQCKFFSWANNVHPSFVQNSRNGFIENKTGDYDRMMFFRKNGIHFYFGCEIFKQTFGSSRKKASVITQWYLQVEHKEKSTAYAKDDIWILSKSKDFQYRTGHLVIAKSVFHGPDKDGKIELEVISGNC